MFKGEELSSKEYAELRKEEEKNINEMFISVKSAIEKGEIKKRVSAIAKMLDCTVGTANIIRDMLDV